LLIRDRHDRNGPGSAAHHSAALHAALRPGHEGDIAFASSARLRLRHESAPAGEAGDVAGAARRKRAATATRASPAEGAVIFLA
jgi:hypothetical protein